MKQFTSPSVPSGPGHTPARPTGAAPQPRASFPVVDFAQRARSEEPSPLEENPSLAMFGATYQRISDLPSPPAVRQSPVFAPHGDPIPGPDPDTGLRRHASRDYVDMDDGTTVRVTRDPATGEWRERLPDVRVARGPALHWAMQTTTWRSGSPASSSASSSPGVSRSTSTSSLSHGASSSSLSNAISPVGLGSARRVDPIWNISQYKVPTNPTQPGLPTPAGYKSLMIGHEQYFVNAHFGAVSLTAPHAAPHIYSVALAKVGRVTDEGLYRLNDGRHFLPVDSDFCAVAFDSHHLRWKITGPPGSPLPTILIETGSAPDKWVPVMAVADVDDLFQSARGVKGYPGQVGPVDLVNSSVDKHVYGYMQGYLRQIISACDPAIHRASVANKGQLIDDYIWTHGYPYDCLASIHSAVQAGRPIPPGMPVFDAFQGLGAVRCSKDGNFNVGRVNPYTQLSYPDRRRSAAEDALLAEWKTHRDARDNRRKGALNEQMYATRLQEDGYRFLDGGTYGGGQNGFDRVFEGPAGHVYILEAKHVGTTSSGHPGNAKLAMTTNAFQMTDKWVDEVLAHSDSGKPAVSKVNAARSRGQLFKVLGTTTEDGKLILFRIDMSPVEF